MKKFLIISVLCLASQIAFSQIAQIGYSFVNNNQCAVAGGTFSTIILTDNSTSNSLSRAWTISGDGNTYTDARLNYDIYTPGTYTIVLTVTYSSGVKKDSITVEIYPMPVFSIVKGSDSICPGESILFSYTLESQTSTIVKAVWAFGDGDTLTAFNPPPHRYDNNYNEEMPYSISLTLTDNNGCVVKVDSNNFVHVRSKPEAAFRVDKNYFCFTKPPITATPIFTNYTDTAAKRSFAQNTYLWRFDDGNTMAQSFPAANPISHTYTVLDPSYSPILIVTDQFGCSDSTDGKNPANIISLSELIVDYTVSDTVVCQLPDTVYFKGKILGPTYVWTNINTTLGHDNQKMARETNIPFRKGDTATHIFELEVIDKTNPNNTCSVKDTFRIRVYDKTPSTILAEDTNECDPNHEISFKNMTTYPWSDDYGQATTHWYFGDSTGVKNQDSVKHTYGTGATPDNPLHGTGGGYGDYKVMMTGTTPYGCPMDTAYQWIHIYRMHAVGKVTDPGPPNPPHGCAPHSVTLVNIMDSLVSSSDINTIIWRWDYDGQWDPNDTFPTHAPFVLDADGNQEQGHTYEDTGIYNVYFTLINEQGCVHDVKITTIKVGYPPLTDFIFLPDTACKATIQIRAFAYDSLDANGVLVADAWANGWAWNDDNGSPIGTPDDTSTISPNAVGAAAVTLVSSHNGCSAQYQPRKEGMGLVCPPISVIDKPKDDDPDPGPPVYCDFSEIPNPFEQKSTDQGAIYLRWYKGDSDILKDTARQSRSPLIVYVDSTQTYSWDSTGWIKDTIVNVTKKGQTIQEKRGIYRPGIIIKDKENGNYGFVYDTGSYLRANQGLVEITLWTMNDSSITNNPADEPWFNICGYCEHTATQKMYISHAKMNFTVSQPNICQRDSVVFYDSTECNVDIFGWGFKFDWVDQPNQSDFSIGDMMSIKNYTPWPKAGNGSTVKFKQTNTYSVVLIDTCGFGCIRTDTITFDVHPQSIPAFISSTDNYIFNNKKDTVCVNEGGYLFLQDKSYSLPPFDQAEITEWNWNVGLVSSTEKNPTLQFGYAGFHDLSLKITNEYNCTTDTLFYDQVLINNIHAEFENPGKGRPGGSICNKIPYVFRTSNTQVLPPEHNTKTYLKYEWDWGDGDTSMYYASANATANGAHMYDLPNLVNKVVVKLRVTIVDINPPHASKGCYAEWEDTVIVERPLAKFTTQQSVFACPQDEYGTLGRTITFYDSSQGNVTQLEWNFGDGTKSKGSPVDPKYKNPTNTYVSAGKYDVLLIATDEVNGCKDSMLLESFIDIAGPQGTVTYAPTDGCAPLQVTFNFGFSSDPQYMPDSIVVNTLGATESTRVGTSPFFLSKSTIYKNAGIYTPSYTLYKTVNMGDRTEICEVRFAGTDTIYAVSISPNFSIEPLYCPGVPISFNNTTEINPAGTPATAVWSFGNGDTAYTYSEGTTQYDVPGEYQVELTVTAGGVCTKSRSPRTIKVMEFPTVTFTPDSADACDGLIVRFEADSLTEIDKERIVRYDWTFLDGKTYSRGKDTNWIERDFTTSGDYPYTLTLTFISDSAGCTQDYFGNAKINAFKSPTAGFTANPQHNGRVGEEIEFDASSSMPGDGALRKWVWDYDEIDTSIDSLTTPSATHKFNVSGEHHVLLTVIDENGCSDTIRVRITVADEILFSNVLTPGSNCSTGQCVFRPLEAKGTFAEFRMEVYDKWGMRVWRNKCEDNSGGGTCPDYNDNGFWWDGTNSQGSPVPAGVYYWVIYTKSSLAEGKPHVLNGSVTIFR